jgi:hypothetical protein
MIIVIYNARNAGGEVVAMTDYVEITHGETTTTYTLKGDICVVEVLKEPAEEPSDEETIN